MAKSKVDQWLQEMESGNAPAISSGAAIEVLVSPGEASNIKGSAVTLGAPLPISENGDSLAQLWSPGPGKGAVARKTVEDILLANGKVDQEKIIQARGIQATSRSKKIGQILLEIGAVKEDEVQAALAESLNLEFVTIEAKRLDRRAFEFFPAEFMKSRGVCGVHFNEGKLTLGMTDPADVFLLDEVKRRVNVKITKIVVVCQIHINTVIENADTASTEGEKFDEIIKDMGQEELEIVAEEKDDLTDLAKASGESPVIRLVNFLIFDAIKQGASDIHIEPHEKRLVIRYRIDGVLFEAMNPPYQMQAACVSRLKIMANMDISERRLPQDGRIRTMVHGRHVDLRVSTVPTQYGEKTVIRILDNRSITLGLEQLGFSEDMLTILHKQIDRPNGVLLVTGPTGSGKDDDALFVHTVHGWREDEYQHRRRPRRVPSGIRQPDSGAGTHRHDLRRGACGALLRQDPDVDYAGR